LLRRIVYRGEPEAIPPITVTNTTEWDNALNTIKNGGIAKAYTIIVNGDIGVAGSTADTFGSVSDTMVTLKGNGKLYLTSQGNMIRITAKQTLIIDSENLTLQGLTNGQNGATQNNVASLVYVTSVYVGNTSVGGTLELRNGTITGNTFSSSTSSAGGGVYVAGTFIMSGGTISNNTVTGSADYAIQGGGVYVSFTTSSFTMNGGTISGNRAVGLGRTQQNTGYPEGGGVYVNNTTFTMTGGEISNNTVNDNTFSNTFAKSYGGGVSVSSSNNDNATFTMSGGTINGNNCIASNTVTSVSVTVDAYGGGVNVYRYSGTGNAIFTMTGGTISGNNCTASAPNNSVALTRANGGGVSVYNGTFRIVTGTIYGSDTSPTTLGNVVTCISNSTGTGIGTGAAAYIYGTAQRGTFSGSTWNSSGNLSSTNDTIRVVNGVLQ